MNTDITNEPRFEITIDRSNFTEGEMGIDLSDVDSAQEAFELVTEWIEGNHTELRLDYGHEVSELETTEFEVEVEDRENDDSYSVFCYYVHPNEPDDADGNWEYRGCYNSVEYRVCGSLEGGDDWWWIEDYRNLIERGRITDRTYTQDTSLIHEELVEEKYRPRFKILIDDEKVDEREVCSWEGVPELKDIYDAEDMLEATFCYIKETREGREVGHEFEVEVSKCSLDCVPTIFGLKEDIANGSMVLEEDEDA